MNVSAVQFKPVRGDLEGSRARLVGLADEAADGADLVVLPEMAATGYLFPGPDAVRPVAEAADGPTAAALCEVAGRRRAWIVAGFPEVDGDALYNSALVISADGEVAGVYRKTLLFAADEMWATPGAGAYPVFDTGSGRFGVGICMDLNDPRFVAWVADSDIDVLAFPTNWLEEGGDVHRYWMARLARRRVGLVAANTYGEEFGVGFSGRSAILYGATRVAAAPATGDTILRARLPIAGRAAG